MKDIYDILKEFEEKEKQESARSEQMKADTASLEAVKEELQKVASTEPVDPVSAQEPPRPAAQINGEEPSLAPSSQPQGTEEIPEGFAALGEEPQQPASPSVQQSGATGQTPPSNGNPPAGPAPAGYGQQSPPPYGSSPYPSYGQAGPYPPAYRPPVSGTPPYSNTANSWQPGTPGQNPPPPPYPPRSPMGFQQEPPAKKKNRPFKVLAIVVCCIFGAAVLGFGGIGVYNLATGKNLFSGFPSSSSAPSQPDNNDNHGIQGGAVSAPPFQIGDTPVTSQPISEDGILTPTQIYEKVSPSVVAITAIVPQSGTFEESSNSYGSGIIMNKEGYILTNAHVLGSASNTFQVKLSSGEEYMASFIAADSKTDLGIIRIDAQGLVPANFGDSDSIVIGDDAYAIGNPGGPNLQSSLSVGHISGINREVIVNGNSEIPYIQTDAAINPGNSGGALINQYGQVIGINTVKISGSSYEGLGFAIPITQAQSYIDQLLVNGRILGRVRIGASFQVIDAARAAANNLPEGLYVYSIQSDSDLLSAGVQTGDVITHCNGQKLTDVSVLKELIKGKQPGEQVELTVFRRRSGNTPEREFTVNVKILEDVDTAFQVTIP